MARLMIADDSMFMRLMIKNILLDLGHEIVAEASNGLEAVSLFIQHSPDLITLDITMPEMNGITALKEIKSYKSDAKVIMVSAMGQQSIVIEAISMGASDFIVKPFDKDRVAEAIQRALKI
ncbi:response regulator [Paenibacillus radicis (ex Xue et al. 2023)]|uniref:Response regulator n=1 Tax=Paenibacillus radicis (ex Xue et al. 2023) TaxID=2972489 RepID=A0ABT1YVE0_9BACL|nr:response regulator [Paenibacillus radicis (ex Xue et al. 2023)]MCR8636914.1 response regulator [Paenibacillus radicis (ex Xue et al. 2023)]